MTAIEFANLVLEMRDAQIAFETDRDFINLARKSYLEHLVDRELEKLESGDWLADDNGGIQ